MQLFSGLDPLRIDIASAFGLDKDWNERLAWTQREESRLEDETLLKDL